MIDLRVEFVKCRARAMRWVEEVYKLAYEMVRVPAFCDARSRWCVNPYATRSPVVTRASLRGLESLERTGA